MLRRIKHWLGPLRYWRELPLRELPDLPPQGADPGGRIPAVVHQTWEDRRFGRSHRAAIERFRDLNPGWAFTLWDREQRDAYLRERWRGHPIADIYERSQFGPMRADIFRYCLLAERGGFYFDISKGCAVPLRTLVGPADAGLITFEPHDDPEPIDPRAAPHLLHPGKFVLQWGLAFEPGHPIPRQAVEDICEAYPRFRGVRFASAKAAILQFTGPGLFTRSVRKVYAQAPHPEVVQAGVDFRGQGIFALPGSKARYLTAPSYAKAKDCVIVL